MNAVLISIQPKWCELIANGKKTVEGRKTKPKIDVPFKCYIYCTQGKEMLWILNQSERAFHEKIASIITAKDVGGATKANGKVIGEFICDRIVDIPYSQYFVDYYHTMPQDDLEATCLCMGHIDEYLLNKNGYGWHITDLVIYETPKELTEFKTECREYGSDNPNCTECNYYINGMCYEYDESDCGCNGLKPITRPPQSWCYVEDLGV